MTVKTRFAPSPTGYLHIGGVRTALFCWLFARRLGGQFVLRIEDTDRERSTQESIDVILEGMDWVGLDYDEEPVYQTKRFDRYREVMQQLLDEGKAYHCYCSKEDLDTMREEQVARGENPRYDGRCRERTEPVDGVTPVVRFRSPDEGTTVVSDLVRGDVEFDNERLDDLIIWRSDDTPTYHFSVVVDDADMAITHVIRGDDHLNNTPRQIAMIDALGFDRPVYAHLPMILGEDGSRLSKRHGAVNVLEYREQGYLPDAVINYLARLGWSHGDQEVFSRDELVKLFDIADVNASASKFNPEKLAWLNQQYIMAADPADIAETLQQQYRLADIDTSNGPALERVIEVFRERAVTLEEMAVSSRFCFEDFEEIEPKAAKKHLRPVIGDALRACREAFAGLESWEAAAIHAAVQAVADAQELGFGKIGQPLRVAVSGGGVSPPIDATLELVGQERTLKRLDGALDYIAAREAASQG